MLGKTTNPLLQQTEQQIQAKVKPEVKAGFDKAVTAGLKIMYGSKGGVVTQQLSKSEDYAHNVGEGVAKLVAILFQQSKGTIPMNIAIPAATVFMCEGLDFLEKAGKVKVTPDLLAETTQDMTASVLQLFGVTPEKMQQMIAEKQGGAPASPVAPAPPTGILNSGA